MWLAEEMHVQLLKELTIVQVVVPALACDSDQVTHQRLILLD
jgi:hypothetical protein